MQIQSVTLFEQVYNQLVSEIVHGKRAPGSKLSEETLCAEYGISRTPIREALLALTSEGLIERIPNRGCYVCDIGLTALEELANARVEIETLALRLGFEKIDLQLVKEVYDEVNAMKGDPAQSTLDAARVDEKMHELLYRSCENRYIIDAIARLHLQSRPFRSARSSNRDVFIRTNKERLAILSAVLKGKKERALELLATHIKNGTSYE